MFESLFWNMPQLIAVRMVLFTLIIGMLCHGLYAMLTVCGLGWLALTVICTEWSRVSKLVSLRFRVRRLMQVRP